MPLFTLQLTTEEIKSLQCLLEEHMARYSPEKEYYLRDVLTKITLVQLLPASYDQCMSEREAAYIRDANYPSPREDGPAY